LNAERQKGQAGTAGQVRAARTAGKETYMSGSRRERDEAGKALEAKAT
jgi:hypothetical protein